MASITEIIGIDDRSVEKLRGVGVRTLEQLLEVGSTSTARMRLADEAQLEDAHIKLWVHQADLMRVAGIGPELAHLLCKVGVFTAPKLAYRSCESLHEDLLAGNISPKIMGHLPGLEELHTYIVAAKRLPKIVRH